MKRWGTVEIDFTRLSEIAQKSDPNGLLVDSKHMALTSKKNAAAVKFEPIREMRRLQRLADTKKKDIERSSSICLEYQQNIKMSSRLQTEIIKGAKAGEDVYRLLLKACKAISLMTSNSVFYSQIEGDIKAIYGQGLLDPLPLQIELQEAQERLTRLIEAEQRELDGYSRDRIKRAIKAHEAKIADLEILIQRQ